MEMKPYGRKTRNHSRSAAQYATHPQGPPYYAPPIDYTAAAATSASAMYSTAPYPPPPAAAYYPPPPPPAFYPTPYPADKRTLEVMVRNQIEYYFSEENLIKDIFLRKKMDSEGFVLLSEIASFQRVASLTQDMDTVVSALKESETIEICDGIKIRPKKEPHRWPFPSNFRLQYITPPQAPPHLPPQLPQPTMIQSDQIHATSLPQQPQQIQHQSQLQPQQIQQPSSFVADTNTTTTPIQDNKLETDSSSPQQSLSQIKTQQQQPNQSLRNQQQPNQKQTQPGLTQSNASSPNNSNISDISSGTNNIDNNNRSSITYATAVTNKPSAASVVAGAVATGPTNAPVPVTGTNGNSSNAISNTSNHHPHHPQPHNHHHTNNNGDIPNNKHNNSNSKTTSAPVESGWKEVKSRRRRPGKA